MAFEASLTKSRDFNRGEKEPGMRREKKNSGHKDQLAWGSGAAAGNTPGASAG